MKRIEWVKGRSFTHFPEWVQIGIFVMCVALLVVMLASLARGKVSPPLSVQAAASTAHSFYIINREEFTNMENKTVFVLEYSCDGMAQITPSFPTLEQRDKFELYLMTLGEVKQYQGRK